MFHNGVEIHRSVMENILQDAQPPETGSSFTALLGLPANQAMDLLHEPESSESPAISGIEMCRDDGKNQRTLNYAFNCSPTFPSKKALEDSPETSYNPSNSSKNSFKLKSDPTDSEWNPTSSPNSNVKHKTKKRKERDKKVKGSAKKGKIVDNVNLKTGDQSKDGEKLPYVHVRVRRGQATDSHSLAERARRDKINARMKLLQELVPGCTKISGMALVLDEIINHVRSLQSQVEFLSMRLAAVNSRIDFSIDNLLASESGCFTAGLGTFLSTVPVESSLWPIQVNNATGQQLRNQQQELWQHDVLRSQIRERNSQNYITRPEDSVFSNYSANSVAGGSNRLKMEI